MEDKKKIVLSGVLLISVSVFIFLSLLFFLTNKDSQNIASEMEHQMGFAGGWISNFLYSNTIGYASFLFPILCLLWGINFVLPDRIDRIKKITLVLSLFFLYFSMGWALINIIINAAKTRELDIIPFDLYDARWGLIGGALARQFFNWFGTTGSFIFFPTIVLATALVAFQFKLSKIKAKIVRWCTIVIAVVLRKYDRRMFKPNQPTPSLKFILNQQRKPKSRKEDFSEIPASGEELADFPAELQKKKKGIFSSEAKDEKDAVEAEAEILEVGRPGKRLGAKKYYFPSPALLDEPSSSEEDVSWDELMSSAKTLEDKLADFGIRGKVVEINPGPVITRFEIEPAPGVKISRFTSLSDDLALVMRAKRIRVVAPIPGKAAVGIEIPNRKSAMVYLKSVIDSARFRASESPLSMALGKTIAGDIYVDDLATMPHLLVAGATGSGKSVCLNTIIASMLFKASPDQVQLVMIDPKRLELSLYSALKYHHLTYRSDIGEEVVTTPANAVAVLRSMELEMERRYELLAKAGVRDIDDYNKWAKSMPSESSELTTKIEPLKYIVLIIDELADLMLTAAREVEEPIARLTQMSRAVGIHLIVATQRPSVDVITGVIKANFPARMAFQVASKTDSRTILDMNGAEKLLGRGDMLFLPPASPEPIRIHAAYISHEEVKRIIESIRQQPIQEPKFLLPTENDEIATRSARFGKDDRDELFNEALKLVVRHQQGSVSLLQRRLKIGYARAARIIDQMEDAGYVGAFDGSKAREVLIDEEELAELGLY